ncbi:hypothetical protein HAX54_002473 [Datura stramonium]|uniref:F-box domain-containing protein n=1 Tax=Datura stramonium TaxID=4076 RepID=A0ABS8RTE0_DATST|nr:hypothetical protein [Datura stramonium]
MPPTDKTQYCCPTSPLDVFSNLPENVIYEILMCLSFKDVVRTSVLSKKWRNIWCRLPELTLDETFWKTEKDLGSFTFYFTNTSPHILTLHSVPITKLTLCINCLETYPIEIDNLIFFLSENGIQHLLLRFPFTRRNPHELPSSLFTCLRLRHLTLENCLVLTPPVSFKGFDRLISLELRGVTISSKLLQSLISHSPLLEQLVLQILDISPGFIEISGPMLKSFDYTGHISCICLNNVPLLAKLSLTDSNLYYTGAAGECDIAKFFEPLSTLEHLHLDYLSVSRRVGEVPATIPFVLHSVKHLCLSGMYFDPLEVVTSALCWIRSFPNLQYMDIQVANFFHNVLAPKSLQVECFSNVTFNHLREVKSEGFRGTEPEMQLMELLLAKSPMLVRMFIKLYRPVEESARAKILAKLSKVKAASPKAELNIFLDKLIDPAPSDAVNEIPASFSDMTWNHLRSAKLEGITGIKPPMELIKLLLAKSSMLVRMLIQSNNGEEFAETRL